MPIHLTVILAAAIAVSAIIALIETKEKPTRVMAGALIAAVAWLGALPYISFISQNTAPIALSILAGFVGVMAVIVAIRTTKPAASTLLIASGVLLAAIEFGLVAV